MYGRNWVSEVRFCELAKKQMNLLIETMVAKQQQERTDSPVCPREAASGPAETEVDSYTKQQSAPPTTEMF